MSAYEQRVEPPDRQWQYLLFAAEPYETIAFKVGTLLMQYCITSTRFSVCRCGLVVFLCVDSKS